MKLLLIIMMLSSVTGIHFFPRAMAAIAAHSATARHAIKASGIEPVSLRAAGRGNPFVKLNAGRDLSTSFSGDQELRQELEQNRARPLALASADFDEDGIADLIAAYASSRRGIISVTRGNSRSIYPNSPDALQKKAQGDFTNAPFLSAARLFQVPCWPDLIAAGDFDADAHRDVVAAAIGDDSIYLLAGDGQGGFAQARQIKLSGRVTALAAGEINRRDGLEDLIVAVVGAEGPKALVFEGAEGALKAAAEEIMLPAEARAVGLGQLDEQYEMDLAVAAGRELVIVYGRDRKLSLDETRRANVEQAVISRQELSSVIKSIAIGDFNNDLRPDVAALLEDGEVQVLSRIQQQSSRQSHLKSEKLTRNSWPQASLLLGARVSGLPGDDLLVLEPSNNQMHIVCGGGNEAGQLAATADQRRARNVVTLDVEGEPVAVLPMLLDVDALTDLVVLRSGHSAPTVSLTAQSKPAGDDEVSLQAVEITNSSSITINSSSPAPTPATPYPSTITVSGQPTSLDKLRVRLNNLSHGFAPDVDILLVGPTGQTVMLLSDAGGSSVVSNATVTFDDDASASVPSPIVSGTFKPTNISTGDVFTAPAPAGPYGSVLSAFNGTNPNGTWSLYIVDDFSISNGSISGGWSLILGTDPPPPPIVVTNTNNSGSGSLRQAILQANSNIGADIINFDIDSGQQTITLESPLPTISGPVTIDGTTQPGFAGTPIIELDGSNAGSFQVGLRIFAGNSRVRGLVINRFDGTGIQIRTGGNNIIEGNYIGTDVTGTIDLGVELSDGIGIDTASNLIGGTTDEARNLISAHAHGIIFDTFNSDLASGNRIEGNYIGTTASGDSALGNSHAGVTFRSLPGSPNNTIGGTAAGARNIISGNGTGVDIVYSGSNGNLVQGNYIGTNAEGTAAVANSEGVSITGGAHHNTIGGTAPGAKNLISGNTFGGVRIGEDTSTDNIVEGNCIGTDASGTGSIGNGFVGVSLQFNATSNTIGGGVEAARNIISGNGSHGVEIGVIPEPGQPVVITTANVIMGNFIGTDFSGRLQLGNASDGIRVPANADGNRIEENLIAYNGGSGIRILNASGSNTPGVRISIQSNLIYSNGGAIFSTAPTLGGIGIDLGPDGVTDNDANDGDVGPNNLQNFPILTSVTTSGGTTHIIGHINSTPNSNIFVQFFSSPQCSGSNPRGNQQILTLPILFRTNSSGDAPIDLIISVTPAGGWVNCIATDPTGNSSEFSPCAQVNAGGGCSFSISPSSESFPPSGGSSIVSVTAQPGCNWTATSNDSWIFINSGSSGTGSGSVSYSVAANTTGSPRSGSMTIAGHTFTVNQDVLSCSFSLSPSGQDFTSAGGAGNFNVTAQPGCNWAASTSQSWITISAPASGSGNGVVNFSVSANSGAARSGSISVADQTFSINQQQACSFTILPTSRSITAASATGSVSVTAAPGCGWAAGSNDFWITVTGGQIGSGNGTVFYSVQANTSTVARSGSISIADQNFTIEQEGLSCTYSLRPTRAAFFVNGGESSFAVTATAGCGWSAVSNEPWITVQTPGGSGNGVVSFIVRDNFTGRFRTGRISLADQVFTVNQDGGEAENCNYGITPSFQSFSASGGAGSFTVIAGEECIWEARSNVSWVTITSDNNGLGTGTVTFSVGPNTGAGGRKGTITVGGKSFSVKQKGSG